MNSDRVNPQAITIAIGDAVFGKRYSPVQAGRRAAVLGWLLGHPTFPRTFTLAQLAAKLHCSPPRVWQLARELSDRFLMPLPKEKTALTRRRMSAAQKRRQAKRGRTARLNTPALV